MRSHSLEPLPPLDAADYHVLAAHKSVLRLLRALVRLKSNSPRSFHLTYRMTCYIEARGSENYPCSASPTISDVLPRLGSSKRACRQTREGREAGGFSRVKPHHPGAAGSARDGQRGIHPHRGSPPGRETPP